MNGQIYIGSEMTLRVDKLYDSLLKRWINDAVVTASLKSSTATVATVTLGYVADSTGCYTGSFTAVQTAELTRWALYTIEYGISVNNNLLRTDRETVQAVPDAPETLEWPSLISASDMRERFEMKPSSEARMLHYAKTVTALFESLTGHQYLRRSGCIERYQPAGDVIYTKLRPVIGLSLSEWDTGEEPVNVDAADFEWTHGGRISKVRTSRWCQNVEAVLTGGYTPDDVPFDIKDALISQVAFMISKNTAGKIDLVSQSFGKSGSASYVRKALHDDFEAAVRRYRRV